ncbi:Inorganic triphosphatase [Methylorubrum aminovorans]|uniref:Inorganic triphosphatase n=1 Tax=Methylorubrum aminovorans TaxID=269069 RepID=A0ABQ4URQ7_9HYPH|nr:CYTH domain-containing protein [Methylorubrum aminovorans]GJE68435.1 Inorganic triphosphatase [Methylorubrum aminovorans]GMA74851.1 adenylate cyclase [Methylorubrum aminovorans]
MRYEVERKFLVAHAGWRDGVTSKRRLTDGLIGQFASAKVRVRLDEERAWLAVKGGRAGLARPEFEYEIPRADGEAMLGLVCEACLIEKTRHCVPYAGLTWEVDVYDGTLSGMILAEVELKHEAQAIELPPWLGQEVTGDPRFRQSAMLRLSQEAGRTVTLAEVLAARP